MNNGGCETFSGIIFKTSIQLFYLRKKLIIMDIRVKKKLLQNQLTLMCVVATAALFLVYHSVNCIYSQNYSTQTRGWYESGPYRRLSQLVDSMLINRETSTSPCRG